MVLPLWWLRQKSQQLYSLEDLNFFSALRSSWLPPLSSPKANPRKESKWCFIYMSCIDTIDPTVAVFWFIQAVSFTRWLPVYVDILKQNPILKAENSAMAKFQSCGVGSFPNRCPSLGSCSLESQLAAPTGEEQKQQHRADDLESRNNSCPFA